MEAAAIILSGGKSSRMGTNKALLKINEVPNVERIRDMLNNSFNNIILVTNDPEQYQFLHSTMTSDHFPGKGPLAGIHAGLVASDFEVNFIVACDMPFVSGELASVLVELCGDYDAVIPVINGVQHPLFAVYKKKIVSQIAQNIEADRLAIKAVLDHFNVLYVTEKDLQAYSSNLERVFFNMNHPDDYKSAKKWAEDNV